MLIIINDSIEIDSNEIDIDHLKERSIMFNDLLNECDVSSNIPIKFKYPDIAANYFLYLIDVNMGVWYMTPPNQTCKYLEFAHYIVDNIMIKNLSYIIYKRIESLNDNIITNLSSDVEYSILKNVPEISALTYFVTKYNNIKEEYLKEITDGILIRGNQLRSILECQIKHKSNVTEKYIEDNVNDINITQDRNICTHPLLLPNIIDKYPNKNWNWNAISENCALTPDIVERHINKPWNWYLLSQNLTLSEYVIETCLTSNKSIDWNNVSRYDWVTEEFIEKHIDENWNWSKFGLSRNKNISTDFIEKHMNKDWSWSALEAQPKKFTSLLDYKKYAIIEHKLKEMLTNKFSNNLYLPYHNLEEN